MWNLLTVSQNWIQAWLSNRKILLMVVRVSCFQSQQIFNSRPPRPLAVTMILPPLPPPLMGTAGITIMCTLTMTPVLHLAPSTPAIAAKKAMIMPMAYLQLLQQPLLPLATVPVLNAASAETIVTTTETTASLWLQDLDSPQEVFFKVVQAQGLSIA